MAKKIELIDGYKDVFTVTIKKLSLLDELEALEEIEEIEEIERDAEKTSSAKVELLSNLAYMRQQILFDGKKSRSAEDLLNGLSSDDYALLTNGLSEFRKKRLSGGEKAKQSGAEAVSD